MSEFSLGTATLGTEVNLEGMEQGLNDAKAGSEGLGGSWLSVESAILGSTAIITAAIGSIGLAAFDIASELNQANADIAAAFGMTREEAQGLTKAVEEVYSQGFGENVGDAKQAVIDIGQQMKLLGEDDIPAATKSALALRDVFGVEVSETANAANTLMQEFGLTSEQAFDFITTGFQNGLDSSGDFLDTIGEYSVQLSSGGASAEQFFSLMESGLKGGMLGTDKAADAFKEFRVRIQDGSTATADALKSLGIDTDDLFAKMATGEVTAANAFDLVLQKLNETDDANLRMQAGVGLLGTQFEDLGTEGALALSLTGTSMGDLAGATDSLNVKYDNLSSVFTTTWRQIQVSVLKPIGDALLSVANDFMPLITSGIQAFGALLNGETSPAIAGLSATFGQAWATIQTAVQTVLPPIQTAIQTVFGAIGMFVDQHGAEIVGFVTSTWDRIVGIVNQVLPPIQAVVTTIFGAVSGFLSENQAGIASVIGMAWETIKTIIDGALTIIENVIIPIFTGVANFISSHGEEIKGVLSGAWGIIQGVVETVMGVIQGVINTVMGIIRGDWDLAWAGVKQIFSSIWEGIQVVLDGALELLKSTISIAWDAIKGVATTAWEGIKGVFSDAWLGLQGVVDDALATVESTISNAWERIKNGAATVFDSIGEGVKNAFDGVLGGIKTMINSAISGINSVIGGLNEISSALGFGNAVSPLPYLGAGTNSWMGGPAMVSEPWLGIEAVRMPGGQMGLLPPGVANLPRGARVFPADETRGMFARAMSAPVGALANGRQANAGGATIINQYFPAESDDARMRAIARQATEQALAQTGQRAVIRQQTRR